MIRQYVIKAAQLMQWGKIVLPLSSIKFFPPQFILRNPVTQGVRFAFNEGYEAAVIVFNLKNSKELADFLGPIQFLKFMDRFKKMFRQSIEGAVDAGDIITLHDYYGDGLSLFIRAGQSRSGLSAIDSIMRIVAGQARRSLHSEFPDVQMILETGYMFVEKKSYSIHEAVLKAHQQAVAMAERRVESEFNELVFIMSKIISQREIFLLAQPIIDVATKEIRAWELLTRGPAGTMLENPLTLFSVARQTGKLYELEMVVLEKALEQIKTSECTQDIFINFTPLTLGNAKFVRDLKKLMDKYKNISPKQITFEITERDSIEEMRDFIYNIKVLRLMGIKIAVDDTGSGYASLNTISEVMPDIIKIDRSLIQNIDKNTVKESMLKGLLLVAKEAGSLVVAEGIENAEEASVLTRNKVDLAQGYFYAKPAILAKKIAT
ncbi:EAL domain-containing protein [Neobacillus notoginsengisoli]|uniref:EAL domain-containing protein n=1 Tax=Neobacillus notoginsengisoli TaxID=1578198 RepID=A0A417YY21_9BACI|nr:EAL domain-containing protein [Neobacillus notoginsengisoli]RHW42649.1 EAL domain-containing protein [Neobacillus notoginsengisoli]